MKLSPRYDDDPLIVLDGDPPAIGVPVVRQRRRLADAFSALSAEQWNAESRCEGWRVQDVAAHLVTVDQFWSYTVRSGLDGTPTKLLADFDPKASPATMVEAVRDHTPAATLTAFLDATNAFCSLIESLSASDWNAIAESPPGHVSLSTLAHHALWDAWIHERDVLTPLGVTPREEPDEVVASLRYASALNAALAVQNGTAHKDALAIEAQHPDARVVVTVDSSVRVSGQDPPADAFVLRGDAVELLEALSVRRPFSQPIPTEHAWLVTGLADVFESGTRA